MICYVVVVTNITGVFNRGSESATLLSFLFLYYYYYY